MLRGPSPVAEGLVGDDLLGCGPFDKRERERGEREREREREKARERVRERARDRVSK